VGDDVFPVGRLGKKNPTVQSGGLWKQAEHRLRGRREKLVNLFGGEKKKESPSPA